MIALTFKPHGSFVRYEERKLLYRYLDGTAGISINLQEDTFIFTLAEIVFWQLLINVSKVSTVCPTKIILCPKE
jgi:hypothetical protein